MADPPMSFDEAGLESELREFRPTPAPTIVRETIAGRLRNHAYSRADRFLLTYMSLGVAAAIVIVTFLSADFFSSLKPSEPPPPTIAMQRHTRAILAELAGDSPIPPRDW